MYPFVIDWWFSSIFSFRIVLFSFNVQSTAQISSIYKKLTENNDFLSLQRRNLVDSRFWYRLCYYCSKWSRPKFNKKLTRNTPSCWQLLLSHKQQFLDNHLPRVPTTPNQQGTFEMREEVLTSVRAQDLDTSSYQFTDLEDIEFNWENSQMDKDEVFRPGIGTPFSPTKFEDIYMEGSVENPIVLDEKEDKEKSAPTTTTTPMSKRPPKPPRLLRNRTFGARMEKVPYCVHWNWFEIYYRVCVLIWFIIKVFHFIITFFKNESNMCEIKTVIFVTA